ncbi:hypothetical protein QWJ90_13070 [Microbacterium oryzae]|nr:hypothetical protein [Microbacterium oryzae]
MRRAMDGHMELPIREWRDGHAEQGERGLMTEELAVLQAGRVFDASLPQARSEGERGWRAKASVWMREIERSQARAGDAESASLAHVEGVAGQFGGQGRRFS